MDFIKSDIAKKYILFDICDVDEFVLNIIPLLDKDDFEFYEVRNFIKRHSFVTYKDYKFVGNKRTNEIKISKKEISNEEYSEHRGVKLIDNDINGCGFEYCSTLNYQDFNHKPLLDFIKTIYNDRDAKPLLEKINLWIDETAGDESKKIRLDDLISNISRSSSSLRALKKGWCKIVITPINSIQEKIIEIHLRLNDVVLTEIRKRYKHFLFKKGVTVDYEVGFKLNTGYGNHTRVLELLEEGIFIKKGTTKSDLINAFNSGSNRKIETPLIWIETKRALNYFISNLIEIGVINYEGKNYQEQWNYCNTVFRDIKGNVITNLSGNNKFPNKTTKSALDYLVTQFKVRA